MCVFTRVCVRAQAVHARVCGVSIGTPSRAIACKRPMHVDLVTRLFADTDVRSVRSLVPVDAAKEATKVAAAAVKKGVFSFGKAVASRFKKADAPDALGEGGGAAS